LTHTVAIGIAIEIVGLQKTIAIPNVFMRLGALR